jgi:hypothetical protein
MRKSVVGLGLNIGAFLEAPLFLYALREFHIISNIKMMAVRIYEVETNSNVTDVTFRNSIYK